MRSLLVLGLMFTLWSLAAAFPANNTAQHKGIVFPKKIKENATMKMEEQKNLNTKDQKTPSSDIRSTEASTESSKAPTSPAYIPLTVADELSKSDSSDSTEQIETAMMQEADSVPEETSPATVESSEHIPGIPLPADTTDGLIEYNLGNPLALRLHLPWWPLKDMLKSIQDAISVMNLTMSRDALETDTTKTKIVRFDNRNYTLKVRVLKPSENNRLLVRLISLTPVIDEGKIPVEKGTKFEDEEKNEALDENAKNSFSQMKKKDDEEEKDDDDDEKEEREKSKDSDSKKEKQGKKGKEEKKGDDSDEDSD